MMIDTKTLRPGDEVAVWNPHRSVFDCYEIKIVRSVGGDGLVILEDGRKFRRETSDDYLIPGIENHCLLEEIDEEIRKTVSDVPYMRVILEFARWYDSSKWKKLPTEALRQIAGIIAEHTGAPNDDR